jgi:hypothetical protein
MEKIKNFQILNSKKNIKNIPKKNKFKNKNLK